jgi:hypothetical protein
MSYLAMRTRPAGIVGAATRVRVTAARHTSFYAGNGTLGIVREDKYAWERRVPLCPSQVQQLTDQGFKVLVQVSIFASFDCQNAVFTQKIRAAFEQAHLPKRRV